ncbi:MAG: cob(I)yrinic acid a,c-diamide adenosyltransferase [Bacteroidales bacterium]|nr:cob(I)yrinic acid a,c-diamide adenosyltransferase [Bacteroidales bacterium]MBO5718308.1 cob(I)yrinic acid a,c-diamide adenosyltransferase [Bacteroidales bacterium]MBO5768451.1 cob(I)yrinic acid a,c-diamide adenosyltransferase [Bacteroidales bacterium]MBO5819312.1 cob(I)yrinic acid a,c-diamide adenosyltransferase [Bacteroidales bacterium]MBO5915631.1 cob(I)yrinic acid a,c-diamide adenosyltransferase [Bacteroidales bacterium]
MKIYTRKGDQGQTQLIGGVDVAKNDPRLEAYGSLDELNAHLALLREYLSSEHRKEHIIDIQKHLFRLSMQLATPSDLQHEGIKARCESISRLSLEKLQEMETEIDLIEASLPKVTMFTIPGGNKATAQCHICRCVCRRCERNCVSLAQSENIDRNLLKYLNRLSDYLYVLSRKLCLNEGEECFWDGK